VLQRPLGRLEHPLRQRKGRRAILGGKIFDLLALEVPVRCALESCSSRPSKNPCAVSRSGRFLYSVTATNEVRLGRASLSRTRRQPTLQKTPVLKGVSKPYLQAKVQSSRERGALESGFGSWPRFKVQRSVLRCCKFRAFSRGKIATESRSRRDGGGGSGIRTHVTVSRKHAFQACAFSHSATPPYRLDIPGHADAGGLFQAARPWTL
jgi:hypothetical protein